MTEAYRAVSSDTLADLNTRNKDFYSSNTADTVRSRDWEENKHPRSGNGQFGSGGGKKSAGREAEKKVIVSWPSGEKSKPVSRSEARNMLSATKGGKMTEEGSSKVIETSGKIKKDERKH